MPTISIEPLTLRVLRDDDVTNDARAARRHALVGPPELWKLKRDFQIGFLKARGLRPDHFLVDIGCGTLRGGVPIIQYLDAAHYFGVEIRSEVLAEARNEIEENNLTAKQPALIATDRLTGLYLPQRFHVVWAFSVLFHMTDDVLVECLAFTRAHLAAGGRLFANVLIGDSPPTDWQGFPVVYRSENAYAKAAAECGFQLTNLGILRDLGHCSGIPRQDENLMLEFS